MPTSNEQTAYMLPDGYASSGEPQVFQGFPGRWAEGKPVAVADLGLTDARAAELVAELGLPLEKTKAVPTKQTGSLISGADLRSDSLPTDDSDRSPIPGLTAPEFRARVEEETELGQMSPVIEAAVEASPTVDLPETKREWPTNHADVDALAAELNVTFGEDAKTVKEKIAALEAAGHEPPIVVVGDGS